MYYIGIDWGKEDCGIAWADKENRIATVYKQVKNKNLIGEIERINQEHGISKLIFGAIYGKEEKRFSDILKKIKKLNLEVEFENENFSTLMAQSQLKEAQKKMISKKDDAQAAVVILQTWLDRKKE
ncbi:MAG: RuvX/YqgF family protein [Patescibacteria group bacterium]